MRLAGRNTGGRSILPFGVDYSDARGWSYTAEAEKVRAAFDLVRSTSLPYAEIARRLNMPRSNLRFILQNPIYMGIILGSLATAAMRGTALAWLGALVMTTGWVIKARLEEHFLREELGPEMKA